MTIENCDVIRKVFGMNELGGLAQNIMKNTGSFVK